MTEFSIFFHQNQLLKIRKFQGEVCNFLIQNGIFCVPVFPLRIQCKNLSEKPKINKLSLNPKKENFCKSEYQKNEILNLEAELEVDGNKTRGEIELVQILKKAKPRYYKIGSGCEAISNFFSEISEIKKISPFKICEIEITKTEKSAQWKILSEKWVKI